VSFLRKLVRNQTIVQPFTNLSDVPVYGALNGVSLNVGRERAMQLATVWSCVKVRAEEVAGLPVGVVERQGRSRVEKPLPTWLQKPNPETTRFQLFELTSASIDVDGNAFWWVGRDRLGRIGEVWTLPPSAVEVFRPRAQRDQPPGPKQFRVDGKVYTADEIVHIPGFTLPGKLRGLSPIEQHRHSLSLAAAAEEYGEAFFANDATMRVVISHPSDPGPDGASRMRDSFARDHAGLRNAHKPGVLFGGATIQQLTIPNEQAQFLETRRYQREDICGIFRVPPHKVQILDRATFSNIEHQGIDWVTSGLMPTTSRIEAAVLAAGLLDEGEHLKFKFQGLLRGDTVSRFASYAIARQWGWLSADDIRELEDMNPLPDGIGETYLEPLNMVPAGGRGELSTIDKVNAAGALVRAGYEPVEALEVVGLQPIKHLGLPPVTVQPPIDPDSPPVASPSALADLGHADGAVAAVLEAAGVNPSLLRNPELVEEIP
jgi:HK97 family phage portal protein